MSDSVLERISQNVLTTIARVTTGNGYAVTLDASRANVNSSPRHLSAYIYQLSPDDEPEDAPIQYEQWKQSYAVVCYVIPTEDDTTAVDVYNNSIAAAVHKELMTDYSRGGLAVRTDVKPVLFFPPDDGSYAGITFRFDVTYRHALDNPFAQA